MIPFRIGVGVRGCASAPRLELFVYAAVRKAVLKALEQEEDVVVVAHSYGGLPSSDAVEGLAKKDGLAKGEKAGVIRMVYVCAFAAPRGKSLVEMLDVNKDTYFGRDTWQIRGKVST